MLRQFSLLLCTILLPAFLLAQTDNNPNIDYKQPGTPMPELHYMAYHQGPVKDKKTRRKKKADIADTAVHYTYQSGDVLTKKGNFLVMLFNPTCGHCESMAALIRDNIDMFKRSEMLLLATNTMATYIPDFAQRQRLNGDSPMRIGYDTSGFVNTTFLYQNLPQINVYSADRKLIKIYSGEVPIDTLKKFIQ